MAVEPHAPYTEGQEPDLDTTDTIDPNAGYQPPDQEEPEPAPPPEDYSDPPVGGFVPPALPGGRSVTYYVDRSGNRQQITDSDSPTATYMVNNINHNSSVSGCSISNGPEHEVSEFRGPNDPGQVHYTYINDEHLKTVSDGPNTYNLSYDALGRCVKRILNGTATYLHTHGMVIYYAFPHFNYTIQAFNAFIIGSSIKWRWQYPAGFSRGSSLYHPSPAREVA